MSVKLSVTKASIENHIQVSADLFSFVSAHTNPIHSSLSKHVVCFVFPSRILGYHVEGLTYLYLCTVRGILYTDSVLGHTVYYKIF